MKDKLEDLTKYGFKQFIDSLKKDSTLRNDPYVCSWQKCYYEGTSKKFYLNANDWDFSKVQNGLGKQRDFTCQLTRKDTKESINIEFLSDNLKNAENFISNLFELGLLDNYGGE